MRHIPVKKLVYSIIILGLLGTGALSLWISTFTIPDLQSFDTRKVEQSTKIYDRTGEILLYDVHEDVRRTVVPFEDMSRNIKNATVAIEDDTFYDHFGIRPLAFLRAVLVDILAGKFEQGGSTITQQVVKLTLLTPEKKISRKLKEWFLSLKLENKLTKDQILEIYLNHAPYGGSIYGIEEAAQTFLAKSAADLSIAEAAYLAALPQAPTYYSPYGGHADELEVRKNLVLRRMYELNFITESEYEAAKNEPVAFVNDPNIGIHAPHFVFYVLEQLEEEYGDRAIEEAGLKVTTTIDWALQQEAERIVNEYALSNTERFKAENAGLVAVVPQTGEILVMVGSRDYFDEKIDGKFNITTAERQPGSAFKPFVYATALAVGYTPETVLFDVPTQFSTACEPNNFTSTNNCYSPGNYDNKFRGPITLRNALAQSVNVPAVKALYLAGLTDSLRTARAMGIETLNDPARYGLTLVLGGGEVTLLDITSAYGVFANEGMRAPHQSILRVEDADGEVLYEFKEPKTERVLDTNVARTISDILSDNVARTPLYGPNSLLYFGARDVAAKTGTTNDYRDAWTVGYTPNLAVGAWAGNNDNRSMDHQISGLIITPLWRAFMDIALPQIRNESFVPPLPDNPDDLQPILRGEVPTQNGDAHSILYWLDKNNPRGTKPRNPNQDPQFRLWEYGVTAWLSQNPNDFSQFTHEDNTQPIKTLTITTPLPESSFAGTSQVVITVDKKDLDDVNRIDFWIGDLKLGTARLFPFTFTFIPNERNLPPGTYTLRGEAYDGNTKVLVGEQTITIE